MEYKDLNGVKIPVLGLGTWHIGEGFARTEGDKKAIEAIRYAISLGITHIDTAEIYGNGHAEELVGQAIKGIKRQQVIIATKVSPTHLTFKGVLKACQGSLKRLGIDQIDLYLIHWPNPLIPLETTIAAMDETVSRGWVRFIGVSNFPVDQVQQAQKLSKNKIMTDQVEYSLTHRDPEEKLLPFLQSRNILLTAYSPLGKGKIAQNPPLPLQKLAQKYGKTPVQIALRYLIQQKGVIAIPKATSREHLDEIAGAVGWELEEDDFQDLKGSF